MVGLGLLAFASIGRADDKPGPIDSISDVQDTGKMLFKLADQNNDGQISQKEAVDAANLVIGGFFFRADANGDGTLSRDEARAARDAFLAQHPILRVAVERNRNVAPAVGGTPSALGEQAFETLVDTNRDGNIQAGELRQIVQTTVTAVFASADTDRNGFLSPTEVNAAIIGMANAAAQAAFQRADTDRNGQISQEEFDRAITEPAHAIFRSVDTNNDGQLSPQEAQAARQAVMSQIRNLRVPEPANSARNIIRSNVAPAQPAPTPAFSTPATQPAPGGFTAPAQPAPAPVTVPPAR
jgi:Ca2+-binding EF-hand superfamily protein